MKIHQYAHTERFICESKRGKIDIINQNINSVKTNVIVEDHDYCSSLETTELGSLSKFWNKIGGGAPPPPCSPQIYKCQLN
jgi:hypothetical protein